MDSATRHSHPEDTAASASGWGLTPIVVFLLLVVSSGVITQDFTAMPTLTAFMITVGYALMLNPGGRKLSLAAKVELFLRQQR